MNLHTFTNLVLTFSRRALSIRYIISGRLHVSKIRSKVVHDSSFILNWKGRFWGAVPSKTIIIMLLLYLNSSYDENIYARTNLVSQITFYEIKKSICAVFPFSNSHYKSSCIRLHEIVLCIILEQLVCNACTILALL